MSNLRSHRISARANYGIPNEEIHLVAAAAFIAGTAFAAEIPVPDTSSDRNNTIAFGPAYQSLSYKWDGVKATESIGAVDDQAGVTFDYGHYFGGSDLGVHEAGVNVSIMLGMLRTDYGAGNPDSEMSLAEGSVSAHYNYNFQLGKMTKIYVGPRLGFGSFMAEYDDGYDQTEADDTFVKYGVGAGLKQQFTDTFGMTLGVEYAMYTNTDLAFDGVYSGYTAKFTDMSSTKVLVSFAWNF